MGRLWKAMIYLFFWFCFFVLFNWFNWFHFLACNCSNCDEVTGKCTCPPHVIGDKCDQCAPGTFGFDPIIGCQRCNCDDTGTIVLNASCNVTNGQCPCKENFSGRKCSVCRAGYFNYPLCRKCDCLNAGVTGDKCNAITGTCFCQVGKKRKTVVSTFKRIPCKCSHLFQCFVVCQMRI